MFDAISNIEQFVDGFDFDAYVEDVKTHSAVERQVLTLSEASRHLPNTLVSTEPEIDWDGLRGIGNRIRHAYFHIDHRVVWEAVRTNLPPLKAALGRMGRTLAPHRKGRPPRGGVAD